MTDRMVATTDREAAVLDRIEAFRRRRPRLTDEVVTLAHGAGGKASAALVDSVFLDAFAHGDLPEWEPTDVSLLSGTLRVTIPPYPAEDKKGHTKAAGLPLDPRVMSDEARTSHGRPRMPERTIRCRSSFGVGCRGALAWGKSRLNRSFPVWSDFPYV